MQRGNYEKPMMVQTTAFKELQHVIKHVLDMRNIGSKKEPTRNANEPLEIVYFSDNDYAGDPVSRRSNCFFILYILGILVSWQ